MQRISGVVMVPYVAQTFCLRKQELMEPAAQVFGAKPK
jgi:succinate dehydrogenase hydrophobic anchor subunit